MKTATIEILEEGETIFGSRTNGEYFVREYEDNDDITEEEEFDTFALAA